MQLQATMYEAEYRGWNYTIGRHHKNNTWWVNRWPVGTVKIPPYTQALADDLTWQGIILFTGKHAYFETADSAAKIVENLKEGQ